MNSELVKSVMGRYKKERQKNLERFPAVCECLPTRRTGPAWCESRRSGCTPDVVLCPAWLTGWTAACPSLSLHAGTFPEPASRQKTKMWDGVGLSPPTPAPVALQRIWFPSKCSHMLRFTHLGKQRGHKHTDGDLARHSKNMEPAATAEIHRGRIPSVCPLRTGSACSSAMFLWKTWLSCQHASWKMHHQNEIKDHKVAQQPQRRPHSNTADWWGATFSLPGTKQNICKMTTQPIS